MPRPRASRKLDHEQFTVHAIKTLRDPNVSLGIHTVLDGFNHAFRIYFEGADPVEAVNKLHEQKKLVRVPRKRGPRIYLPNELPKDIKLDNEGNIMDPATLALSNMGLIDKNGALVAGLSHEDFTIRAIERLRDVKKSPGIHVVYNGFNAAFRRYFDNQDPKVVIEQLQREHKVVCVPWRGGARLYLANELPDNIKQQTQAYGKVVGNRGMSALKQMGLSEHPEP